jgi:hypothetical protein
VTLVRADGPIRLTAALPGVPRSPRRSIPEVCASALLGRATTPDAIANPRRENILRREIISLSIISIISNLLDFDVLAQSRWSVRHLDTLRVVYLPVGHSLGELQRASHFVLWASGLLSQVSPSNHYP